MTPTETLDEMIDEGSEAIVSTGSRSEAKGGTSLGGGRGGVR